MEKQHELIPMHLSIDDLAKMPDAKFTTKWPKQLSALIDVLESLFKRKGMNEKEALEWAFSSIREIANYHGGKQFYLPTGKKLEAAFRNRKIFNESGRKTAERLGVEHNLATASVYAIIQEQTTLIRNKIQPKLL